MKFIKVFYNKWISPVVRQAMTKHFFWGENCNKVAETVIWGRRTSQWQQFDAERNSYWIGTNSHNGKVYLFVEVKTERTVLIKTENNLKKKRALLFPFFFNNSKISSSILKPIFKLLTRSWSTFDSRWSCRIISKTTSFIMSAVLQSTEYFVR